MVLKVSEIYKDKFLSLNMTLKKEGYQEYKLKNGLKVALLKTPTQTVSCLFIIWHSALYESKKENGIAHFLEHILVTGGTKKYNPETVKEIIGKFGYFNAYTSLFNIYFQADILKEDLERFRTAGEINIGNNFRHTTDDAFGRSNIVCHIDYTLDSDLFYLGAKFERNENG